MNATNRNAGVGTSDASHARSDGERLSRIADLVQKALEALQGSSKQEAQAAKEFLVEAGEQIREGLSGR